jgi:hypothetical protein
MRARRAPRKGGGYELRLLRHAPHTGSRWRSLTSGLVAILGPAPMYVLARRQVGRLSARSGVPTARRGRHAHTQPGRQSAHADGRGRMGELWPAVRGSARRGDRPPIVRELTRPARALDKKDLARLDDVPDGSRSTRSPDAPRRRSWSCFASRADQRASTAANQKHWAKRTDLGTAHVHGNGSDRRVTTSASLYRQPARCSLMGAAGRGAAASR